VQVCSTLQESETLNYALSLRASVQYTSESETLNCALSLRANVQ